jgi:uracil-DNA glycosylase family 4
MDLGAGLCGTPDMLPAAVVHGIATVQVREGSMEQREAAYEALVRRAAACRLCPRMEGRRRVLDAANGPLDALILFVAEAPGRFGGDRTGVPLTSDQSGRNFSRLLAGAGIARHDVFVTNAALCNPRDVAGRNATPTAREIANCRPLLADTLALVHAPLVVALGRVALAALAYIAPHALTLRHDVGRVVVPWRGRHLAALYHPGPRAQLHRCFAEQQRDFLLIARAARALGHGDALSEALPHGEGAHAGAEP